MGTRHSVLSGSIPNFSIHTMMVLKCWNKSEIGPCCHHKMMIGYRSGYLKGIIQNCYWGQNHCDVHHLWQKKMNEGRKPINIITVKMIHKSINRITLKLLIRVSLRTKHKVMSCLSSVYILGNTTRHNQQWTQLRVFPQMFSVFMCQPALLSSDTAGHTTAVDTKFSCTPCVRCLLFLLKLFSHHSLISCRTHGRK